MVEMGWRFYETLGYHELIPFVPEDFAESLRGFMRDHTALVMDGGMGVAITFTSFVNHNTIVGAELFFWVDPEKRGAGMSLLDALESRARALGARTMSVVTCQGMKEEALARAYERRGYVRKETTYVKEL